MASKILPILIVHLTQIVKKQMKHVRKLRAKTNRIILFRVQKEEKKNFCLLATRTKSGKACLTGEYGTQLVVGHVPVGSGWYNMFPWTNYFGMCFQLIFTSLPFSSAFSL